MKHYFFSSSKKRQYLLIFCDSIVLAVAVFASYAIRVYINQENPTFNDILSKFNLWQVAVIGTHLFTLYLFDQYNLNQILNKVRSSIMLILSIFLAGLIISGIFFFLPKYLFGRQVLLIHLVVVSIFMVLWRLLFSKMAAKKQREKRLAITGDGRIVSAFIEEIARMPNSGYTVNSICILNSTSGGIGTIPSSLAKHKNLLDLLDSDGFDALAFDPTSGSFSDKETKRILELKYRGKAIYDLPALFKTLTGKVPLSYIDGRWLLMSDGLQGELSMPYVRAKRLFDITLAFLLLIISSPLLALIGAVIKLESKGGVFYTQERLGIRKKSFKCIKFRTMLQDAERESGPIYSNENDIRTTRLGKWLRKLRLDELPQLWNILKGEMSFVGPRPIREHFALQMAEKVPFYWLRYDVKPGVTGWAQTHGAYAVPDGLESFQYDLFYIQNMSFFLDFFVLLKTLNTIFLGKGK